MSILLAILWAVYFLHLRSLCGDPMNLHTIFLETGRAPTLFHNVFYSFPVEKQGLLKVRNLLIYSLWSADGLRIAAVVIAIADILEKKISWRS